MWRVSVRFPTGEIGLCGAQSPVGPGQAQAEEERMESLESLLHIQRWMLSVAEINLPRTTAPFYGAGQSHALWAWSITARTRGTYDGLPPGENAECCLSPQE